MNLDKPGRTVNWALSLEDAKIVLRILKMENSTFEEFRWARRLDKSEYEKKLDSIIDNLERLTL